MNTLVVNFFGGPSSRKTNSSNAVLSLAQSQHLVCEQLSGCEKELIYDGNIKKLKCQPYIMGEQLYRLERLFDKVDFILNDLPIPLNITYKDAKYPASFDKAVIDIFNTHNNLNIFLTRNTSDFVEFGRVHNLEESIKIDNQIIKMLLDYKIPFIQTMGGIQNAESILELIKHHIKGQHGKIR